MKIKYILLILTMLFILGACSNNTSTEQESSERESNEQETPEQEASEYNDVIIVKSETRIPTLSNVSLSDFKQELAKSDSMIIDLRTTGELEKTGIISGAMQIDYYSDNFKEELNKLDKDEKYLIYCQSGGRSGKTLQVMKDLGFKNVFELRGGMNGWLSAGEKTDNISKLNMMNNNDDMMSNDDNKMMSREIILNARRWEFDQKVIRAKKGEKLTIKVNNMDVLHGIAIPDMKVVGDNEIEVDTSKVGEFQFVCANFCGEGHQSMTGVIIIE